MTLPGLDPKRILVIHVTRIGDTIMTTPALRAIAESWPQAEITFLGHPKRGEVVKNLPFIRTVGSITKNTSVFKGWFHVKHWDLAFVFGFDKALVKYALRVANRVIAFRQNDETINARLFKMVEPSRPNAEHGVDQLLRLPKAVNPNVRSRALAYKVDPQEYAWAARSLHEQGVAEAAWPLVGFVIESFPTKPYRDWRVEHFAELAHKISSAYSNAYFVLLGGKISPDKVNYLKQELGEKLVVLAGTLSLRETAAVMAHLDLYVGVDTGPSHLAAAVQLPTIIMYHCKHPSRCLAPPEHPHLTALDHPLADSGQCNEQTSLSDITVERVWLAAKHHLEELRAAHA